MSGYEWHNLMGILGVLCILAMYLAIQLQKIDVQSDWYSLVNAAGALLIIISLCFEFNLSAFLIETAWLLISVFGLIRGLLRRSPA